MSRIGVRPITVPSGVTVDVDGRTVRVKGPKGELSHAVAGGLTVATEDGEVTVKRPDDELDSKALHGLTRTLIQNMVTGVTEGFTKKLEIVGTGYRVQAKGSNLELALGFSHSVVVTPPEGISFSVEGNTKLAVEGIDKQQVGEVAANIRKLRPPEPYKGKGVRYEGEHVRRKSGKKAK
ncbi:MAG: 50S ribosomal protein L6 [Streptosporangiales bacterium]|nr:50S ribosomal protein L6 [Streptosporangiales bacterium]